MSTLCFLLLLGSMSLAVGQPFISLDFESAKLSPIGENQFGGVVTFSEAFPGWSGSVGDTPMTTALHNNSTIGGVSVDILGPNWTTQRGIIEHSFTAELQTGGRSTANGPEFTGPSLFQTGEVPQQSRVLFL
jgi:hypothetical protein